MSYQPLKSLVHLLHKRSNPLLTGLGLLASADAEPGNRSKVVVATAALAVVDEVAPEFFFAGAAEETS